MSVSVLALGAALDTYFGGGGLEWLADLCMGRSDAEINTASMTGLPPAAAVPMLGVGLGTAALALFVDSGKAPEDGPFGPPPSADERLRLLLAMSSVAATTELPSLSEFSRIYRFVCGGNPYPGEVSTAYDRCASGEVIGDSFVSLTEVRTETERQRILAAVVLLGCSDGGCGPASLASINRIVLDIGTTDEDVGEVTRILTMDTSAPVPMVDLRLDANRRREGFWAQPIRSKARGPLARRCSARRASARRIPRTIGQRPTAGWATSARGLHFIVPRASSPNRRANVAKAPARGGGRALPGGTSCLAPGRDIVRLVREPQGVGEVRLGNSPVESFRTERAEPRTGAARRHFVP